MLLFLTSPLQRLLRGKTSNGTSSPMGRGNATNCVKTAPTRHWKANPWMGTWNSGTPSQQLRQCNLRGKMSNGTFTPMVRGNDTNCVKIVTTRHWRTNPWMGTLNSGIPSQQLRQCNVEQRRTKNSSTTLMNIRLVLLCFLFRSKRNLLWFYSVFFFLVSEYRESWWPILEWRKYRITSEKTVWRRRMSRFSAWHSFISCKR